MPEPYGLNYGLSEIAKGVTGGMLKRPLYQQEVESGAMLNEMLKNRLAQQNYQMGQTQAANQALSQPQEPPEGGFTSPYEQEYKMYETAGKSLMGTPYASKGMELMNKAREAQMNHVGYLGQQGAKRILGGDLAGATQSLQSIGVGIQDIKPAYGEDGSVDPDTVMVGSVIGKNDDGTPKTIYSPVRKTDIAALAESANPTQAKAQMDYISKLMASNMSLEGKKFAATTGAESKVNVQQLKNEQAQSPIGKLFQDRNRPGVNMSDAEFNSSLQSLIAKNKATSGKGAGIELTPQALDDVTLQFIETRKMPALGMGAGPIRLQILNNVPVLAKKMGLKIDPALNEAEFSANKRALTDTQSMYDAVTAFEKTAQPNIDLFLGTASKISDSQSPWVNKVMREVDLKGLGSADQAAFNAAKKVAETEVARVVSNPNLKGVLHHGEIEKMEQIMSGNYTYNQLKAVVKILKQDMDNRKKSLEDKISEIKDRMPARGPRSTGSMPSATSGRTGSVYGPVGPQIKEGHIGEWMENGKKVTVKAINGNWVYQ